MLQKWQNIFGKRPSNNQRGVSYTNVAIALLQSHLHFIKKVLPYGCYRSSQVFFQHLGSASEFESLSAAVSIVVKFILPYRFCRLRLPNLRGLEKWETVGFFIFDGSELMIWSVR